ncbi:MAG: 30S ribosomal protein S19e [Candidatus Odinarchaeota archaeon]
MSTVYDVPADQLIPRIAEELKKAKEVTPPEWASYVKTGAQKERRPTASDWWYIRCASILRRLYVKGPSGVSRLRTAYGDRKRRGVRPNHFMKGGGSIVRTALQQLEAAGLVEHEKGTGRRLSRQGRSFLDKMAHMMRTQGAG